jgi:hypothetical protein
VSGLRANSLGYSWRVCKLKRFPLREMMKVARREPRKEILHRDLVSDALQLYCAAESYSRPTRRFRLCGVQGHGSARSPGGPNWRIVLLLIPVDPGSVRRDVGRFDVR